MDKQVDTGPTNIQPKDFIDRAFRGSLYLKGLDGLAETIGGILLLLVSPEQINHLVRVLTQSELSQDPHDLTATYLLSSAHHLTGAGLVFAALYLLSHGIVKIILVVEVLRDRLWAYPGLIIVTGLFIAYQLYRMLVDGLSAGLLLLTIFDFIVVYLTLKEYRRHKARYKK